MKKLLILLPVLFLGMACTNQDSNQSIRDNETIITAKDKVDNHQTPGDTILLKGNPDTIRNLEDTGH